MTDIAPEKVSRPLKIALIHAADQGGGAERSVVSLHEELRRRGHDSRLYVGYKHSDGAEIVQIGREQAAPGLVRGVQLLERRFGLQGLYAAGFRALASSLPSDVDVVHIHSLWGSGGFADIGAIGSFDKRFPLVMTLRDEWMLTGHCACTHGCERWLRGCGSCPDLTIAPAISRDGTRVNALIKRRAVQRTSIRVTAVSNWLAERARLSPTFRGKEVVTIYNGVDLDVFSPDDRTRARSLLELPADAFIVLAAGQSIQDKPIPRAGLRALNLVKGRDVFALVIGHGSDQALGALDVRGRALPFLTDPSQLALCYQAADVTLVTSEVETFGRIAAESQACGTPVVTYDSGGLPEVVHHGIGGFVAPRGDVGSLVAALGRLCGDRGLRREMSFMAAREARRRFANAVISDAYVAQYRLVIGNRAAA